MGADRSGDDALGATAVLPPDPLAATVAPTERLPAADLLGATVAAPPEVIAASARTSSATLQGDRIGRFVVIQQLGEGGMGVVVSAYDPDLDRKVAVKLVRSDKLGEVSPTIGAERRERMIREARAMARLAHPNVLTVHEVGLVGGNVFIAMEFAARGTLRAWCEAEPRGWRDVITRFAGAARGLAAAHAAGLVHRDFKPDNVLITEADEIRVADFGLVAEARATAPATTLVDGDAPGDAKLTSTGSILGTPIYMAPEQFAGTEVGPATDQFAFCVALWEALYGKRPFAGETYVTLRTAVARGALERPTDERGIPPRIRLALERGLAARADDRWPSITELVAELQADPERARKRRRVIVAGALGAAALVAAIIGLAVTRDGPAPRCEAFAARLDGVWDPARRASLISAFTASGVANAAATAERAAERLDRHASAWVDARTDACRATDRGEQSETVLDLRMACFDRRLDEVRALAATLSTSPTKDAVNSAIEAVGKLPPLAICNDTAALTAIVPLPERPEQRAVVDDLRREVAEVAALLRTGKFADGIARAKLLITRARAAAYPPVLGELLYMLGELHDQAGDAKAAVPALFEAVTAAAEGRDHRTAAAAWILQVKVLGERLNQFAEAETANHAAVAALAIAGKPPDLEATYQEAFGGFRTRQGHFGEALALDLRSLALREQLYGPDHMAIARSLLNTGNALDDLERSAEGAEYTLRAIAMIERVAGPHHPLLVLAYSNLGAIYEKMEKLDDQRIALDKALAIARVTHGDTHRDLANIHSALGSLHKSKQDHASAIAEYEIAIDIATRVYHPRHPSVADPMFNRATTYIAMGKRDEGLAQLAHVRELYVGTYGDQHARVLQLDLLVAGLNLEAGKLDAARTSVERVIAVLKAEVPIRRGWLADSIQKLAQIEEAAKRPQQAIARYLDAAAVYAQSNGGTPHADVLLAAALIEMELDKLDDSMKHLEEARAIVKDDVTSETAGYVHRELARLHVERRAWQPAAERARSAIEILGKLEDKLHAARARFLLARALLATDKPAAIAEMREADKVFVGAGATGKDDHADALKFFAANR